MKHIYRLFFTILLLCLCGIVRADKICDDALAEGKQKYNAGNLSAAKQLFEFVANECGANYGDASAWAAKCSSSLSVSRSAISVDANATTVNINVTSNQDWILEHSSGTMFYASKNGNSVKVSIYSNTSTSPRSDYFYVKTADGSKSKKITISQAGAVQQQASLSVSANSIYADASGKTEYITVSSNVAWEVEYPSNDMYYTSRDGSVVKVVIKSNTTPNARSDFFNIKTSDGSIVRKINLSQAAGASVRLSASKTTISAPSSGTTEYITISCGKSWELVYPSGNMYSVSRSGNTLTVTINQNTTSDSRSDYFKVKTTDGTEELKISMSQSAGYAARLSASKTSISAPASGTTEYITITCGKSWELVYPNGNMYSVSRSGNSLTVTINRNTKTEARSDYFKVKTTDGTEELKISMSQSAASNSHGMTANIQNVWVEHNQYKDGEKGMRIHVKFDIQNHKSKTGRVSCYFYKADGTALKDTNGYYKTNDGNVACGENFTPGYDDTIYEDFKLFMPYSELHTGYVSGAYKFYVAVWGLNSYKLAESDWQDFTMTY